MYAASMANAVATLLLLAACVAMINTGAHAASMVTGTVFCDQCRDGYISLLDYPLSGVKVAMLCPVMGGLQTISQETTNIFGTYTMRFDGTPNFGNCYTQVIIQQQEHQSEQNPPSSSPSSNCLASVGPSKTPRLTFSFFGITYFSVEPLISQPPQPMSFCSGWTGSSPRPPPNPTHKPYPSPPSKRPDNPETSPSSSPPSLWPPSSSPTSTTDPDPGSSAGSPLASPPAPPTTDPNPSVSSPASSPSPTTSQDDSVWSPSSSHPSNASPPASSVSSPSPGLSPSPSPNPSDDDDFKFPASPQPSLAPIGTYLTVFKLQPPILPSSPSLPPALPPSMMKLLAVSSPCSHEYWSNPEFLCHWRFVTPKTRVAVLFGSLAGRKYGEEMTLWMGLQGKGNPYRTLLRETITAYLNAYRSQRSFPYTAIQVVQQLNLALSSSSSTRRVLLTALQFKRANSGHWRSGSDEMIYACGFRSCK